MTSDDRWEDARRIEAWAGEVRVNLIRLAAIIAFYGNHLVQTYLFHEGRNDHGFHVAVTAIVLAWATSVLALYVCLSRRYNPPALKHIAVGWDIVMVTAVVIVAGAPKSTLAALYFLVIASAPLRLSLPLVYFASLGSMAAYVLFLGYYKYFLAGVERYPTDPRRLTRADQVIFVLALGAAGLFAGQMVRQARRLSQGYVVDIEEPREG
jgi:hypothetical protein